MNLVVNNWLGRLMGVVLLFSVSQSGQSQNPVDSINRESDDFVTVSFLVGTPLDAIYSVFGHATLRMQCPDYNLDYVFTFESDTNVGAFMTGVAGKAKAKYVAVPIEKYIQDAKNDGRELRQYRLNLTLEERKRLWQLLDEEMMAGAHKNFNLMYDNCLSTSLRLVKKCLIDEKLEWGKSEFPLNQNDGDYFRYLLRNYPWTEFVFVTFIGSAYNGGEPLQRKIAPENVVTTLRKAKFVNEITGESRPVISDEGTLVVKGWHKDWVSTFSPAVCFSMLLILTLVITVLQFWRKYNKLAVMFDILLFSAQALMGIAVFFMTFWSELFHSTWNWYFISFFPVPILLWMFMRGKKLEMQTWMAYSVALALFICLTPFVGALDLPHQLITGSILVRSLSKVYSIKTINT